MFFNQIEKLKNCEKNNQWNMPMPKNQENQCKHTFNERGACVKCGKGLENEILFGHFNWGQVPIPKEQYTAGQDIKKGEQVEITRGGFVLPVLTEDRKREIIRACLQYAKHRIRSHNASCGISGLCKVETLDKILSELDKNIKCGL